MKIKNWIIFVSFAALCIWIVREYPYYQMWVIENEKRKTRLLFADHRDKEASGAMRKAKNREPFKLSDEFEFYKTKKLDYIIPKSWEEEAGFAATQAVLHRNAAALHAAKMKIIEERWGRFW